MTGRREASRVGIIGAGFAGLGMAIQLKRAGIHDFVVLESGDDVGGTWRVNTYPGCACDVPSHLYSFSFAPNPNWSHIFARQPEILAYLRDCAQRFGILPHIRFGHQVQSAEWDDAAGEWVLDTEQGTFAVQVVVAATGPLSQPQPPASRPGRLRRDRLPFGSLGSRARPPRQARRGGRAPARRRSSSSRAYSPRWGSCPSSSARRRGSCLGPTTAHRRGERVLRAAPAVQRALRAASTPGRGRDPGARLRPRLVLPPLQAAARPHLRRSRDPQLRRALTPDYRLGCKRILASNDYYPALTQRNSEVITEPIARIEERAIVTEDGAAHEVDTIIFATGFHVTDNPMMSLVRGRTGQTLSEAWQGSPQAYLGMTVPGFPNGFLMVGPNTGLGNNSIVFMIEAQVRYVLSALRAMDRGGLSTIEVRPEVHDAFHAEVQQRTEGSVWTDGGCRSWYLDRNGRNSTLWPDFTWRYALRTRKFDVDEYRARLDLNAVAA